MRQRLRLPADAGRLLFRGSFVFVPRPIIFVDGIWQHYDVWQIVHVPDMHDDDPTWRERWAAVWPLDTDQPVGLLRLYLVTGGIKEVRYPDFRTLRGGYTDRKTGKFYQGQLDLTAKRRWHRVCWRLRETGADPATHVVVYQPETDFYTPEAYQWFPIAEYNRRQREANAAYLRQGMAASAPLLHNGHSPTLYIP